MIKKILLASSLLFSMTLKAEESTFEKNTVKKTYPTGFKVPKNWKDKAVFKSAKTHLLGAPRHYDLRQQGKLSPIEDQGNCGDCWAFSTAATFQDALSLKGVANFDLSEQFLLSCNHDGWSCDGGFFAHDYHVNPGAVLEKDFPYKGVQVSCPTNLNHPYKLVSWAYIPTNSPDGVPSVDEIKAAILQYGTISAGVAANDAFMNYKTGIFNGCDTTTQPNHAINLVGWDDDGQYWIMRNSWGSNWGENGYMRIKWGCNFIGESANYIVVDNKPVPQCNPAPQANLGKDLTIRRGAIVTLGQAPIAGTTYRWESSIPPNPTATTSQIKVQPWSTRYYTLYTTTKCGTAKSTILINVHR